MKIEIKNKAAARLKELGVKEKYRQGPTHKGFKLLMKGRHLWRDFG